MNVSTWKTTHTISHTMKKLAVTSQGVMRRTSAADTSGARLERSVRPLEASGPANVGERFISMISVRDPFPQAVDLGDELGRERRLERARARELDFGARDDAPGPRARDVDRVGEISGLAQIVGHENDRRPLLDPKRLQHGPQILAGERVERAERLVE